MKFRLIILALLVALLTATLPSSAMVRADDEDKMPNPFKNIPIHGTFTDSTGVLGTFTGTFDLERFALQDGQIVAIGDLKGTLRESTGREMKVDKDDFSFPVTFPQAGGAVSPSSVEPGQVGIMQICEVLHLVLGPLHLELLGLIVDLNQVVLTITADPAGGLLGQLLCAIAGDLELPATVERLQNTVNLLNQIIALLNQ